MEGVKSDKFQQSVRGLGPRITAWRADDIRAIIEKFDCFALDCSREEV